MLATEKAQGPFSRSSLSSSLHARSRGNAGTTSFVAFDMPQQYSTQIGTRGNGGNGARGNGDNVSQYPSSQTLASLSSHMSPESLQSPSSSTLVDPNDGPQREDNIMNRRARENSSLYQICIEMKRRLSEVPGFEQYISEMEEEEHGSDEGTDPVTSMWNCLRRGIPLMTLYNALRPPAPLEIDQSRYPPSKLGKAATFKFLQACFQELKFLPNECFVITDLYAEDTTGFVKVTKVVNRVLDLVKQKGFLLRTSEDSYGSSRDSEEPQRRSHRQNVIEELVTSERDYVQHLETLQQFKNEIEQSGAIPGDAVHDVFLNLNALLDFQRRFLIRIEQQNSLDEASQNWGRLFYQYQDGFRVYEPFIGNHAKCNATVAKEWDKLRASAVSAEVQGMVANSNVLTGFLLKPFQRLTKYPMLLQELRTKGGLSESRKKDLADGEEAAKAVLQRANEAMDKEARLDAVDELQSRVEDWKGHNIDHFGQLMLYGCHTVLKGDGQKEVEREVRIIFDALDPQTRMLLRQETLRFPLFSHLPHEQTPPLVSGATKPVVDFMEDASSIGGHPLSMECRSSSQGCVEEPPKNPPVHGSDSPERNSNLSFEFPEVGKSPSPGHESERKLSVRKFFFLKFKRFSPSPKTKVTGTVSSPFAQPDLRSGSRTLHTRSHIISRADPGTGSLSPSRKGQSNAPGPLTNFGDKFKFKVRKPEHRPRGLRTTHLRNLDPQFLRYYLDFNAPLKSNTILFCTHSHGTASLPKETEHYLESIIADEEELCVPVRIQYKVYLFERILLCCKEINPNKPKNRLGNNKSLVDKKGKLRLQLKGRIFMQNVTDVISFSKHGSYFIQIFWKGDPGVENFIIRFANEEVMKKWRKQVEGQMTSLKGFTKSSGPNNTSETEFTYLRNQTTLKNPYQQDEDVDDEEDQGGYGKPPTSSQSEFAMSRNASSTSLRSRSTTGGSGPPLSQAAGRVPPPRFPVPDHVQGPNAPPLTLSTNFIAPAPSPNEFVGNSYFSPTMDSPVSTRSSGQNSMFPFPRQLAANNVWVPDDSKHNTAPPVGRAPSRDGQESLNSFSINGRTVQRPSLPVMTASQTAQQMAQSRMRSASSPDFQNANVPGQRRFANGHSPQTIDSVPVPPIPLRMAQVRTPLNRSQTSSPTNNILPLRNGTQSPSLNRDRIPPHYISAQHSYEQHIQAPRSDPRLQMQSLNATPIAPSTLERVLSPPLPSALQDSNIAYPSQLKMVIWFSPPPSHVTIVVPIIIKYRSLIDRIDSKMEKISAASIAKGTARLKFIDPDGDYVSMNSDEDIQLAIEDWGALHEAKLRAGISPDFELHWSEV